METTVSTDMAMEAKKKNRNRKAGKNRRFLSGISLVLPALLVLQACQVTSVDMTPELASQIAADASGLQQSEITDLTCTEENGDYTVSFSGSKGTYTIGVDGDGKVTAYTFARDGEEPAEDESGDDEESDPAGNSGQNGSEDKGNTDNADNTGDSDSPSQEDLKLPEGSLSRSELIQATAEHLKKTEVREDEYTLTVRDDGMVEVAVPGDDGRNYTVTMDPKNGQIVYTQYSY